MIYVCVPVHNEARTVGLVLWKVRQVFTAFEREYQIIACDDSSTDGSADVLTSYARVLPLTVIQHRSRQGYAKSLEELLRLALQRTDRPKRDCAITLHADFVHAPETMEEMVKRLESGADLVVAEQYRVQGNRTWPERWARRWAWRSRGLITAARKSSALLVLALLAAAGVGSLGAQDGVCTGKIVRAVAVPFPVGERLSFNAKYGIFNVGNAAMEVMGIDTVHNVETVHIRFRISGGALWYHLDQTIESWVGR